MNIIRKAQNLLERTIKPGKVIVLHGARRVGKTFLVKEYLKTFNEKYIF